jgi:hypothetical protein
MAVLRWILHRILPHACFLIDTLHLAARLAVTVDSIEAGVVGETDFARSLLKCQYKGPLSDFAGNRWWIDGVEQWLWTATDQNSDDKDAVHTALKAAGFQFEPIRHKRPVVALDSDFRPQKDFAEFDDVVAINLDDWPSYAEPAYVRIETVKENPRLRMNVDSRDRSRL